MKRLVCSTLVLLSVLSGHALIPKQGIIGMASWYGSAHHGKKTSSGRRFNKNELTAASPTLPFGTKVRVTFLRTGLSTVVTITDRGPFGKHRILDISEAAADAIGMKAVGVGRVKLEEVNVSELPANNSFPHRQGRGRGKRQA